MSKSTALPRWIWLTIVFFVVWGVLIPLFGFRDTTELHVYVLGAQRLLAGEPIHVMTSGVPPFAYPPVFAIPFIPIAHAPETVQRLCWLGAQVIMVMAIIAMINSVVSPFIERRARERNEAVWRPALFFWFFLALLGGRYLLSPLENQSHDLMVMVCILGGVLLGGRGREVGGGLLLGLAAAMKATPLLFLPVLIWQRRWRAAGAMILGLSVASVATDLVLPPEEGSWNLVRWVEISSSAAQPGRSGSDTIWAAWNPMNQNLSSMIHRWTTDGPPDVTGEIRKAMVPMGEVARKWVIMVAQAMVLGLVFLGTFSWGRRCQVKPDLLPLRRLAEAGVVACGMLLLSPMSSKAHFALLLMPLAVLILDIDVRRRDPLVLILLVIALFCGPLSSHALVGGDMADVLLAIGSVTIAAMAIMLADIRFLRTRPWSDKGGGDSEPKVT